MAIKFLKSLLLIPSFIINLIYTIGYWIISLILSILIGIVVTLTAIVEELRDHRLSHVWKSPIPCSIDLIWKDLNEEHYNNLNYFGWFNKITLMKRYQMWLYNIKQV